MDLLGRLLAHVEITDTCWRWTASVNRRTGYGQINRGGKAGGMAIVHRIAYEMFVGPIPVGSEIDHLCHNADKVCEGGVRCRHRRCVNPAHLEAVPHKSNMDRASGRREKCSNGHLRTAENTYLSLTRGWKRRTCRDCEKARYKQNQAAVLARKRKQYHQTLEHSRERQRRRYRLKHPIER